jgi:TolB-like protein/cytochrome c-type biogenesis protein CcmH/NrfG
VSLFAELKRRNVFRAGAFYAASAWLLVQVATQVFPFFHIAEWVVRWIVIAAVISFPFALLFSWFYEWTPQGLQREGEVAPDESIARNAGKKLDRGIIAALGLAVVFLLADKFVLHKDADGAIGKSIAVLPLLNESGDPDGDYFSDGLSEELIANLAQVEGLKVIGRSSSFRFKGGGHDSKIIGEKLGVGTLLEGTVRRQGERVRIVAELIDAADGRELWSQTYDRELKDIFAVQSGIAQSVADSLKVKLMPGKAEAAIKHHVPSFETYDHFLLGRQLLVRDDVAAYAKAVVAFRQAVALDPDYAEAWSGLAMAESFAVEDNRDATVVALGQRRAMAAAERAVALDPELGDAYAARGYLRGTNDWNWNGAEADLIKAVGLDPGDGRNQLRLGYLLSTLNRLSESSVALGKCVDHDPLFPPCWYWLGRIKAAQGDYEGARQTMKRVLAIDPEYKVASYYLGVLWLLQGNPAAALEVFVKLERPAGVALAEHDLGHAERSKAALDQLIAAHATDSAYQVATVYAWSGDREQAFVWLERAIQQHEIGLLGLTHDPLLHRLRADPRFAELCRKVGLPAPNRTPVSTATGASPPAAERTP